MRPAQSRWEALRRCIPGGRFARNKKKMKQRGSLVAFLRGIPASPEQHRLFWQPTQAGRAGGSVAEAASSVALTQVRGTCGGGGVLLTTGWPRHSFFCRRWRMLWANQMLLLVAPGVIAFVFFLFVFFCFEARIYHRRQRLERKDGRPQCVPCFVSYSLIPFCTLVLGSRFACLGSRRNGFV